MRTPIAGAILVLDPSDFDGDGRADIAVSAEKITIWRNLGAASFGEPLALGGKSATRRCSLHPPISTGIATSRRGVR